MAFIDGKEALFSANVNITNKCDCEITQSTGESETAVMSQKAVTDKLAEKFDTANIAQEMGESETAVMSQKATGEALKNKLDLLENETANNKAYCAGKQGGETTLVTVQQGKGSERPGGATIVQRTSSGQVVTADPTGGYHAVNLQTLNNALSSVGANGYEWSDTYNDSCLMILTDSYEVNGYSFRTLLAPYLRKGVLDPDFTLVCGRCAYSQAVPMAPIFDHVRSCTYKVSTGILETVLQRYNVKSTFNAENQTVSTQFEEERKTIKIDPNDTTNFIKIKFLVKAAAEAVTLEEE